MSLVMTSEALLGNLQSQTAVGGVPAIGPLTGLDVVLFTNTLSPTPQTTLSDLALATTVGLAAPKALVWAGISNDGAGGYNLTSDLLDFFPTATVTVSETIAGYGLTSTTLVPSNATLVGCEVFAQSIPVTNMLDACQFIVQYNSPASGQNGQATQIL